MPSSTTLTISHSPRDGLLVHGTSKGDAAGPILTRKSWGPNCRLGFRWSNWLDCWYLPHSRGHRSPRYRLDIDQLITELEAAGFTVVEEIDDDARRNVAEAERGKLERVKARADGLNERAGSAAAKSEAGWRSAHQIAEHIPPGQPILVGHRSERRARRDAARIDAGMRKSIDEGKKAARLAERAASAEQYEARRYNPRVIMRRIDKLEADRRAYVRVLEGRGSFPCDRRSAEAEIETLDEQITYWREQLTRAEENGFKRWSKADFKAGDYVHYRGTWWQVIRANAKTLTIPHIFNDGPVVHREAASEDARYPGWTYRVGYDEVDGRMSADEMTAKIEAAEKMHAETTA
ncbi:DUF3560 domain-containing protein [Streptomyces albus]|uniref:DUF3560 domain-containing protein n=1 Tax=Streptomyces albus TaxID=1888 RepID=UPI0033C984C7